MDGKQDSRFSSENAFGSLVVSKNIEHLLFNCSGFISPTKNSKLSFEPLVSSRKETGFTQADTFWAKDGSGNRRGFNPSKTKVPGTGKQQVIATKITGKPKSSASGREISVIVVSDTDFMADTYYEFARTPVNPSFPIKVQNSSFASGLIHHMAKNQNRFRSLDRKYVDPKVVSQFDSRIRSIREDYAPRVQAVDNSINSANQVVRGASIAFRDKDPKFSRAEMYLALQASKEKIIRLQRDKSRLIFERDELIKLLKESPFSGWIRVFGHNGHVRIERNYLSGEPHGMWKRMDASGKEVKSEKFLNKNPATNDFNENEFRTQRSMHLKKQKGQVERIRKLFAE